jgi:hypothetical protein
VEGPSLESELFSSPTDNPQMTSIEDYWDEQTIEKITELLREYNDLFPTTFTEMKCIT